MQTVGRPKLPFNGRPAVVLMEETWQRRPSMAADDGDDSALSVWRPGRQAGRQARRAEPSKKPSFSEASNLTTSSYLLALASSSPVQFAPNHRRGEPNRPPWAPTLHQTRVQVRLFVASCQSSRSRGGPFFVSKHSRVAASCTPNGQTQLAAAIKFASHLQTPRSSPDRAASLAPRRQSTARFEWPSPL